MKPDLVRLANGPAGRSALVVAVVAIHLLLLALLAASVPWTPDERGYLLSGRNLLLGAAWEVPEQRFQGPLGLLANQLFVDGAAVDPAQLDAVRTPARLGMLVFPALLLAVVGLWARALWGFRGALLALGLAATSPTLLAYGPLLAVDVALTATSTLAFFALWSWLRAPSVARLGGLGVATGLMLATKYTSLLLALAIPLAVAIAVLRGADPSPPFARRAPAGIGRRAVSAGLSLLAAAGIALLTLHACYLFHAPRFDPAHAGELTSGAFRALTTLPGGGSVLGLFPEPFVVGADYQATVSRNFSGTFLDHDGPHWAYYPASLLTKTPLGTLGLFALALIAPRPAGQPRAPRFAGVCLGAPALVLLVYLSVASSLQMGVRYLLPVLPLMFIRAGAWATTAWAARGVGRAVTGLAALSCVAAVVLPWPHHIGAFNALVGGPAGGFRLFADGNCDWGQRFDAGQAALRDRHSDAEFLRPGDDPRFGLLAGYALDLKPPDPERPGRTYHWATRFQVVDHDSAAWLLFRAWPDDYEAAIADGDQRAARDLALARLRWRDFDAARRALERAPADPRTGSLREIVDAAERIEAGDPTARMAVVDGLQALGYEELALEFFGEPSRDALPRWFLLAVDAGRLPEAVTRMRWAVVEADARPVEALMLAQGLFWQAKPEAALDVLERHEPPPDGDPLRPKWQNFLEQLRKAALAVEKLRGPGPIRR